MHLTASDPPDTSGSTDLEETRPMSCVRVGLDCPTCVRQSARQVSALCAHLSEDQQKGVFLKLYPDRACHVNMKRFQQEYVQVTGYQRVPEADLPDPKLELAFA